MDFIRAQFDKLLLTLIVLFFTVVSIHAFTSVGETALSSFATDQAKLFAGALLTLITGKLLAGGGGKNGDGKPPASTPSA